MKKREKLDLKDEVDSVMRRIPWRGWEVRSMRRRKGG